MRLVYPPRCLACGGLVESDFGLCAACWRDTPFIEGLACDLCGLPLPGGEAGERAHCDQCLADPPPWSRGRAVMLYHGTGRRLVMQLKHGDRQDIAAPGGQWMAQVIAPLLPEGTLVAPIPLHRWRRIRRSYNQSALLGRHMLRHLTGQGAQHVPDLLQRIRATPSLDGKSRSERHRLLSGALRLNPRHGGLVAGRPLLLIDDVMTSGATFRAATGVCRAAGAGPVLVLALARVGKAS
ncbi:Predicted amidophosphoribosyltransferases [Pseudooceanicola antarcticus]|uniref:Predicted amidophosphoribosyltransferases n=1 Tax=Pseudooceanicola antarcticus TaxID=1247613 RepID=A0A285HS74_9RHOB|nr:Predicted amidophosphoribosyltransferases [Pseudooceanicola antarcticus]